MLYYTQPTIHYIIYSPWCEIKNTSAAKKYVGNDLKPRWEQVDKKKHDSTKLVKGRNEPCRIVEVVEAIAGIGGEAHEVVRMKTYENTLRLFFP